MAREDETLVDTVALAALEALGTSLCWYPIDEQHPDDYDGWCGPVCLYALHYDGGYEHWDAMAFAGGACRFPTLEAAKAGCEYHYTTGQWEDE